MGPNYTRETTTVLDDCHNDELKLHSTRLCAAKTAQNFFSQKFQIKFWKPIEEDVSSRVASSDMGSRKGPRGPRWRECPVSAKDGAFIAIAT